MVRWHGWVGWNFKTSQWYRETPDFSYLEGIWFLQNFSANIAVEDFVIPRYFKSELEIFEEIDPIEKLTKLIFLLCFKVPFI